MGKMGTKKKFKKPEIKECAEEEILPDDPLNLTNGENENHSDDANNSDTNISEYKPKRKIKKYKMSDVAEAESDTSEEPDFNDSGNNSSLKNEVEEEYEVEEIVGHKFDNEISYFLVRWKGYGPETDSWEPEDTVSCPELIRKYQNKNKGTPSRNNRKSKKDPKKRATNNHVDLDPEKQWEVDRVIDMALDVNGGRLFRIRWKGYRPSSDTWEPEEHLNCEDLIAAFLKKRESIDNEERRELRENPKKILSTSNRRTSRRNSGRTSSTR